MRRATPLALAAVLVLAPACERAPRPQADELTVYSGRNERLIGPLLERFESETGIRVRVRYANTSELAATLLEEGRRSPADAFLAQDAAALATLSAAGLLAPLPAELLERVPARFASERGDWVGLSGRARIIVYNPERVSPEELPRRLEDFAARRYRGRYGLAPTNASFQAHMAAYRAARGREATVSLLASMGANSPQRYPNNSSIVSGVASGEIDWGLTNHYYLWRALREDPNATLAAFHMPEGLGFVDVACVGLLDAGPTATTLVEFLLSEAGQSYFAAETFEYPLVAGVEPAADLEPLENLGQGQPSFDEVARVLPETLELIVGSRLLL